MKKDDIVLKSCPFCGGIPVFKIAKPFGFVFVQCNSCGASSKNITPEVRDVDERYKLAAEFWNKRF